MTRARTESRVTGKGSHFLARLRHWTFTVSRQKPLTFTEPSPYAHTRGPSHRPRSQPQAATGPADEGEALPQVAERGTSRSAPQGPSGALIAPSLRRRGPGGRVSSRHLGVCTDYSHATRSHRYMGAGADGAGLPGDQTRISHWLLCSAVWGLRSAAHT